MEIKITGHNETDWRIGESWQCMEGETSLSHAGVFTVDSWLGRGFVKTNLVGGVGTPPENRRRGYVRAIFDEMFRRAP